METDCDPQPFAFDGPDDGDVSCGLAFVNLQN